MKFSEKLLTSLFYSPDPRTIKVCKANKIPINHIATQIERSHYYEFDYLIGMDGGHLADLKYSKPKDSKAKVALMGDWKPNGSNLDYIVEGMYIAFK